MSKRYLFCIPFFILIIIVLTSVGCTKKVTPPPTVVQEDLTVVIGAVNEKGDTTIYLQTVVHPPK